MLDYLQKFNNLPKENREKINSSGVVGIVTELENKYKLSLAAIVMKVATEDILLKDLERYFVTNFSLTEDSAKALGQEMKTRIFDPLAQAPKKETVEIIPLSKGIKPQETHLIKYSAPTSEPVKAPEAKAEKPVEVKGSNFFFSPDDEEEIRNLVKKIDVPEKSSQADLKERVDKVLAEVDINFGTEILSDRFKKIIETYLKGIRNRLDTKTTLQKPFDNGGLGFDEDSINQILGIADKYRINQETAPVAPPKKIALPEDTLAAKTAAQIKMKNSGIRDVDYDFTLAMKKAEERKAEAKQEPKPEIKKEEVKAEKPEEKKTTNIPQIPPIRFAEASGKVKIEDIKAPKRPMTMTPLDELKYLDLINFRRLSRENLLKGKDKIREKIRLLESEGYEKRIEGVKAWRSSPINKLYLQIGEESISKNEPVDVIIEERKARGKDYLTNAELEAIMDLNSEFRF